MIHGKSDNKFVRESYKIIMYIAKNLFLFIVLLFIVGCSKTINVTGNIKLVSNDKRMITIIAKDTILLDKVCDIWFDRNYLYGYYYEKNVYLMFMLNTENFNLVKGKEARNKIVELQLPVTQWTNYPELSGDFVSDKSRRDDFMSKIL